MNLVKIIDELEWVYENMNEYLIDAEDLGATDVVNRIEPSILQLRITIGTLMKELVKEK